MPTFKPVVVEGRMLIAIEDDADEFCDGSAEGDSGITCYFRDKALIAACHSRCNTKYVEPSMEQEAVAAFVRRRMKCSKKE